MAEESDVFFKPRESLVQGRLDFLAVNSGRIVVIPIGVDDFTGVKLHWVGGKSTICKGPGKCSFDLVANPARDYFYAPCYLFCHATRAWKPFVLPVGNSVDEFKRDGIISVPVKLSPRFDDRRRKKGITLEFVEASSQTMEVVKQLKPFDIIERLRKRFAV